ncbi:tetratricopeptide repeat protein [Pseudanabaena sp. BC1403]|uniref:CHAT domain-containing protein n=1 Tax=Pseudanabaena sp. BC1403 TaxID=2043171 RepID=UPI000CD82C56|nr:tetratricopeptide repeat protein [Pseudanabaena sp. BC1403]
MNLRSRYGQSLSAISLVVCPLLVSVVTLPEVVFGAEVQELRSHLGLVAQATTARKAEIDRLRRLGNQQYSKRQYREAFQSWEQSLQIYREIGDLYGEATLLNNLGLAYNNIGQYQKAIDFYQQSLAIFKKTGNHNGETTSLNNLGLAYNNIGQYQKAIDFYQQSLAIKKQIGDRNGEATSFNNLGAAYNHLGQYQKAIDFYQQSLEIFKKIGDPNGEATSLNNLAAAYRSLGQYQNAIDFYQQSLEIFKKVGNRRGEATSINSLGTVYNYLGQYQKAIGFYQQSLEIRKKIGDRNGQATSLGNLGTAYKYLGQYQKSIDFYLQSLAINKEIGDRNGEATSLNNLGLVYNDIGKYEKAIDFYLQSLVITKQIRYRNGEATSLGNLGGTYNYLGQYQKAIDFYLQSLAITKQIGDRNGEARSLNNLGLAYRYLGQYQKAIDFYLQSLAIQKEIGYRSGEGTSLNNLGLVYNDIGQYEKAIDFYLQSLAVQKEIGYRSGEGTTVNNLGLAYNYLGQYQKAIDFFQESLVISKQVGNRDGEGLSLSNLGGLFVKRKQPELAILFYKQSINVREAIRKDIRKLDQDIQKSYLNTVEGSYRRLADLLLKQGRIMEALQVLDLLKVQELQDFFKDVKGNEKTAQGIELLNEEKEFWQSYSKQNIDLTTANTPQILQQLRQTAPAQNIKLAAYKDLQTRLQKLGSNSALLYPLILEDRLELVLFVPNAPPISRTVKVTQAELIKVAEQFREDIQKPNSLAVLDPANKLYNWMIEPIANDLKQANIQTIIYAPDGVMRHVPLAALYDGKQWLVEKYRINYITALSLTNIDPQIQQAPRILAGAFTDRSGIVKIGDKNISFSSLPAALPEVENLVTNFPNTTKLVDKDFNRKAIASDNLNQYNIIHFATHAHLVAGSPEDSFVLLNNNEYVTLRQVKDWKLPNVGLAVFSACQTALGGKLSSGIEIIGFGYQLQQAQARASIATLWEISDGGTQALMGKFYERMKLTSSSAEALQQAQIDLIRSNGKSTDEKRAGVRITWQGIKPEIESQLNHPYYWAPFILIGNGF